MERVILSLSFALALLVWVCGLISSGAPLRAGSDLLSRFWVGVCVATPLLVFLATLPSKGPLFAAGHGFGSGFLIGGLAGFVAVWTLLRTADAVRNGIAASGSSPLAAPVGLSLAAACAPSLFLRGTLLDALLGIAIGWVCASIFAMVGTRCDRPGLFRAMRSGVALGASASALFCAMMALGELGGVTDAAGSPSAALRWSAPAAVFAAFIACLLLIALFPARWSMRLPLIPQLSGWIERSAAPGASAGSAWIPWRIGMVGIGSLVVGRLAALRYAPDGLQWHTHLPVVTLFLAVFGRSSFMHVIALGVASATLIAWLTRDMTREASRAALPGGQTGAAAAVVLAAALMVAFHLLAGLGVALLGAILLATACLTSAGQWELLHEEEAPAEGSMPGTPTPLENGVSQLVRLTLVAAIFALYRLVAVRFEDSLRGFSLNDHFALFGILFGAMTPPLLTRYLRADDGPSGRAPLVRLMGAGLVTLALPAAIVTLAGTKCLVPLLIGFALSCLFEPSLLAGLLALASTLAVSQWTGHAALIAQFTRDQKITILFWSAAATAITLILIEAATYLQRRTAANAGAAAGGSR